jgi:hypothetical protein
MNKQLESLRQQALNVEAYKHRDDPEIVKLRAQIDKLNKDIIDYLEQYIPEELRQ